MIVLINYAIVALWTAVLFPFAVLSLPLTLSADASIWMARELWAPVFLRIGGARIIVKGQEHVDPERPTIYVSNHQSTIDIPILLRAIPVNFRFVAKAQLKWVPFLGWYLWLAGHILIDRGNSKAAIASLDKGARQIRSGTSIVVFPEGTRSDDGRILPFKKGPFLLALKAGVHVVPVTIEGTGEMMPKNSWNVRKNRELYVTLGEPIDASKYSLDERAAFIKRVRDVIIDQSVASGGKGGDKDAVVAERGEEGIGRAKMGEEVRS